MGEMGLGTKISWFLYQKGMGVAKPDFLLMTKFGDSQWFSIAETLMKDNNLEGRNLVLDQLLRSSNFRNHPKRSQFLRLLANFLVKGILDERRRVVKYLDENAGLFTPPEDVIRGPLITAQRDKDTITANTAESALEKMGGIEKEDPKLWKKDRFR
ncbi:MAG TPA: hypothetical protein VJ521_10265 [Acidobacteriota bacterium]|nr:hypothetical protein [Acidobacteriota bacterium]